MNQNALPKYHSRQWHFVMTYAPHLVQLGRAVMLLVLLVSCCFTAQAQGNYVVNTANNTSLGTYNTLVGPGTGANGNLTGDRNAVTGYNAGFSLTSGNRNSFFGVDAGKFTTTGGENTFMGFEAGLSNTNGTYNTMIGRGTGRSNTTGNYNTYLGWLAGYNNTTGSDNIFVGPYSGISNTTGYANVFLASNAGRSNTTGHSNIFLGFNSGNFNTIGIYNSYIGYNSGFYNSTGYSNVSIGQSASTANQTGHNNVMIGDSAGYNNTIFANVFVGSKAGYYNKINQLNTYLGYRTGYNAVADSNTFVGYQAGYQNTSGLSNTFFGVNAGRNISTGSHNTIIGNKAGPASVNTDDNVYMGYNTGAHDQGSQNTLIGTQTDVRVADGDASEIHRATAIGYGTVVSVSDAVVLGNKANVGIGTSTPTARLHIRSEQADESGLRLEHLTAQSPTVAQTDKFLSVDGSGRVVLARYRLHYGQASDWADRVFAPGYVLRSLVEVEQYVTMHQHLPGMPSAGEVVKEGVDVAQLNAKLLEKVEELTLYMLEQQKQITTLQTQNRRILQQLTSRSLSQPKH